ncbi:MAG TPA: TylF/MycF/NovP-related O-methyltransferase, partial [Bacteroidia bacterium]|nr:TylF/MycF/NovP-related O-methyltransferase [Bacteroidia bacterium]
KYMDFEKIEKPYLCIDTFSGFTPVDKKVEKAQRNKSDNYNFSFIMNNKSWFEKTMGYNRIKRVKAVQADICKYNFDENMVISFAFLDVDLYRPSKDALQKVYQKLSTNGIILVDDCKPSNKWDGALQAYKEFTKENNLKEEYISEKLGLIIKRA